MRTLDTIDDPALLPTGWLHGDLAPWNLKWRKPGELAAVDWEMAQPEGLPLQDIFHFQYIQFYLFGTKPRRYPPPGRDPSASAEPFVPNDSLRTKLLLFYLVKACADRRESGEFDHAEFFAAQLAQTVLDAA